MKSIRAYTNTQEWDAEHRLTVVTATVGGVTRFAYDGTRAQQVNASGTTVTTCTCDAANRLTRDGVFTYTYSAAGQLVRAQSGNATLGYIYTADGLRVAQSVNGAGTPWKTW